MSAFDTDGIGFVFAAEDPYCGIDMDNCISRNGALHPAADEIQRALAGYVEFSPSGAGLHIIARARLNRGRHTLNTPWGDELALYDRARFFTMSDGGHGVPRDAQAVVDAIVTRYFPAANVPAPPRSAIPAGDMQALVEKALADPRVAALWHGDSSAYGGDDSAADLALCSHLARLAGGDRGRIDELMRRSGRMRPKWDERRGESTYGWLTIERALT